MVRSYSSKKKFEPIIFKKRVFGPKMVKNGKVKKFWSIFFCSESIQNVLKRILKGKCRYQKFFPTTKFFFWDFVILFLSVDSSSKIWKNWSFGTKKLKLQRMWRGSFLYTWHWIREKIIFSVSHPTLRIFLIFHLCGHFIENWKKWSSWTKKSKL